MFLKLREKTLSFNGLGRNRYLYLGYNGRKYLFLWPVIISGRSAPHILKSLGMWLRLFRIDLGRGRILIPIGLRGTKNQNGGCYFLLCDLIRGRFNLYLSFSTNIPPLRGVFYWSFLIVRDVFQPESLARRDRYAAWRCQSPSYV
jgi:hypothetical protein